MKKVLSILLAAMLVLTSVAALAEAAFTPAATYDPGPRTFNGGVINAEKAEAGSAGAVTTTVYAGIADADYSDEKVYTYNDYMPAMGSGLDWNPHTWETSDDAYILDRNTIGFYDFAVNETKDGYSVVPEMAAELPVDVTSEYAGKYGVAEGEVGKAWRIALNPAATWDDGTPINADSYVYSLREVLNPLMLNRRADSYYDGNFSIVNAKNYLYAGSTTYNLLSDGVYADTAAAIEQGAELFVDMWGFYGLQGMTDKDGNECPQYVGIADETSWRDLGVEDEAAEGAWISAKEIYDSYFAPGAQYESEVPNYVAYASESKVVSWEDVGIVKVDDYTIDLIVEKPVGEPAFYVPYNLSSMWLVKEDLYEDCKSYFDADGKQIEKTADGKLPEGAVVDSITTNYCTSVETSASYGPYTLTYYELDKQFILERNEKFYGWTDGRHVGQYQTDRVVVQIIAEQATQLMTFLSGGLDRVSLTAADMEKYGSSDYINYEPQSYTTKLTFNLNYEKLLEHGTNSQVVVIDEFRKAFALSLDRQHFATSFTASHQAGYGLLNYMYIYDPFTGALYRDSDAAKEALLNIYGLSYGEGSDYATLDEAYAALTGYDMDAARELMAVAYDKAVAAGIYDGQSPITIEFRVYQNDTVYVQMFTYIDEQLKKATEGTGFDGKLSLTMVADPDYYETNYSGGTDMIFTTWGGSSFDPFGTMSRIYTDASDGSGNQMEYGFDTTKIDVTMNIMDKDITASLQAWSVWMGNGDVEGITDVIGNFADYTYATRCAIYAVLEEAFLSYYPTTPMYYRYVAALRSQKVNYAVDNYLQLAQFGMLRYYNYNYDDAAWADYIASGTLQY